MKPRSISARSRHGFTLVELLAVIAIIGILAAILIPVVGHVRKSAKRAECVSNLRQLIAASHLYANEHKGNFPVVSDSSLGLSSQGLVTALLPYVNGGAKIFYCTDQSGNNAYENQQSRTSGQPYWTIGYYWLPSSGGPFSPRPSPLPQTIHGEARRVFATCLDFNGTKAHDQRLNLGHADGSVSTAAKGKRAWQVANLSTLLPAQ